MAATGDATIGRVLGHFESWSRSCCLAGLAAAGKSALVPFSGWLPRAMEGPTPSSAVFYGALSVHLGAFLLLRVSPLLDACPPLAWCVVAIGLATAVFAYATGRVQTDIKSALCFASLSQVGIIVAEIGLGHWLPFLWYVALVHLLGHACLRTLQFVRAPTLLQDYHTLENAIGERLPHSTPARAGRPSRRGQAWLYRAALERGYLDALLKDQVVGRFIALFRRLDALERRWTDSLTRDGHSREAEELPPTPLFGTIEELDQMNPPDRPLARTRDPRRAGRLAPGEPDARPASGLPMDHGLHRPGVRVLVPRLAGLLRRDAGRAVREVEPPAPALRSHPLPARRAVRADGADDGAAPLPDRAGDGQDPQEAVLVLLVARRGGPEAGPVQLGQDPGPPGRPPRLARRGPTSSRPPATRSRPCSG